MNRDSKNWPWVNQVFPEEKEEDSLVKRYLIIFLMLIVVFDITILILTHLYPN